jgi:hypothetical protein
MTGVFAGSRFAIDRDKFSRGSRKIKRPPFGWPFYLLSEKHAG